MKSRTIVFVIIVSTIFQLDCIHDKADPERIELESFEAFPGNNRIYLQWKFLVGDIGHAYIGISRIENGERKYLGYHSIYLTEDGFYPNLGTYLDTTCSNGEEYGYFLEAVEHPVCYFSDTIYSIPKQGLSDPVPPSPDSLSVEYSDSTFTIRWRSPQDNDSLYYIYRKDSTEAVWYSDSIQPLRLNQSEYTEIYSINKYLRIAVIVDGILSLPSDSIHVIQP